MTSAINPANPVHGNPTTESVRDNFAIAAQEISNLQTQVAGLMLNMPYLPLSGATMTGPLTLVGEPTAAEQAATKNYVDLLQARSGLSAAGRRHDDRPVWCWRWRYPAR